MASVSFNNSAALARPESPLARSRDDAAPDLFDAVLLRVDAAPPPPPQEQQPAQRSAEPPPERSTAPASQPPEPSRAHDQADLDDDDSGSSPPEVCQPLPAAEVERERDSNERSDEAHADQAVEEPAPDQNSTASDAADAPQKAAVAAEVRNVAAIEQVELVAVEQQAVEEPAIEQPAPTRSPAAPAEPVAKKPPVAKAEIAAEQAKTVRPTPDTRQNPERVAAVLVAVDDEQQPADDAEQQPQSKADVPQPASPKKGADLRPSPAIPQAAQGRLPAGSPSTGALNQGAATAPSSRDRSPASREPGPATSRDDRTSSKAGGEPTRSAAAVAQERPAVLTPKLSADPPPAEAVAEVAAEADPPAGATERVQAAPEGGRLDSLTGRLPRHLVARGAEAPPGEELRSGPNQTRLLSRVARAVEAAQQRGGEIRLRLSPPELGSLRLEVKLQQGVMTARIEAETTMARDSLLENLPVLRERLAEQGVRIDQFDVDLMDRQSGQAADGRASGGERHAQNESPAGRQRGKENAPPESAGSPGRRRPAGDGGLDVVV